MKDSKKLLIFSLLVISLSLILPKVVWGYGEAGTAPVCTNAKPAAPWLYYAESIGTGQVKLVWDQNPLATSWTVAYGVSAGTYIYGVDRFGNSSSRSITINGLPAGTYYFVVRANNDCMPGPFSNEQNVRVGRTRASTPTIYQPPQVPTSGPGVPTATPTPRSQPPRYGVPTSTPGRAPTATPLPRMPLPTPTPTPRPGFVQGIINFFLGLFR